MELEVARLIRGDEGEGATLAVVIAAQRFAGCHCHTAVPFYLIISEEVVSSVANVVRGVEGNAGCNQCEVSK